MNNKCVFCGNIHFTEKKVQYIYKNNTDFIIVNDVPCQVCSFCGEQYFQGKDLEIIEDLFVDIHNNKRQSRKKLEVPIEEFGNIFS